MSRTSFMEVYSRKPTECRSYCREIDSKGSQNACSSFIENRKPTSCTSEQHTFKKFIENNKNDKYCRLGGGGNTRGGGGGGGSCCCSSKKSSNLSPCVLRSTKTSAPPSPSPYCRSYKHQQTISQRQKQPQRQERNKDAKGNCPCVSNGQASSHNPQELQGGHCSSQRTNKLVLCLLCVEL